MSDNLENAVKKVSNGLFIIPLVLLACLFAVLFFVVQGWFLKVVSILGTLSILSIMLLISDSN